MNENEVIAEALIGDEAKKFLESELGKCLLGMAMQEVQLAQEALEIANPTDCAAIEKLQNKARLGRQFEQWLKELFTRGENALRIYRHESSSN